MPSDSLTSERLFADFLARLEREDSAAFEAYCAQYPEHAAELRERRSEWNLLQEVVPAVRPHEPEVVVGAARQAAAHGTSRIAPFLGDESAFAEETRRFLQERLRLMGLLAIVILALVAVVVLFSRERTWDPEDQRLPMLFVALVVTAAITITLAMRRVEAWLLGMLDAVLLHGCAAIVLASSALHPSFASPVHAVSVAMLVHMILARAILIASTARRTLLLSLPIPVAALVLEVMRGRTLAFEGQAYASEHFVQYLGLSQVCLLTAVGLAALASRINLRLRRRTFEAARLGRYELHELLGRGGMGVVYRATHSMLDRPTAVKLMRPEIAGHSTLQRFEREVRNTCRLSHPNIVAIYDYGMTADGTFYYAMELLNGLNLRALVQLTGRASVARAIYILKQACEALEEAHAHGLIHRDVKPANIVLCHQGDRHDVVKLLDFGLVKDLEATDGGITVGNSPLGTPETMAPELITGEGACPQTDVYSLCAVGYYLLTASPVFERAHIIDLLQAHRGELPEPPSARAPVPRDLEVVLLRGLAKRPVDRFETPREMRQALEACADSGLWGPLEARTWWGNFDALRRGAERVSAVR